MYTKPHSHLKAMHQLPMILQSEVHSVGFQPQVLDFILIAFGQDSEGIFYIYIYTHIYIHIYI